MVKLQFGSLLSAEDVQVGPAPWFRIAGNFIRQGPHDSIVGMLERHQWRLGSHYYTRIATDDTVRLHFEDAFGDQSPVYGPFSKMVIADGAVHVDQGLFAKFVEETQLWHAIRTENYWPTMIVTGVGASGVG